MPWVGLNLRVPERFAVSGVLVNYYHGNNPYGQFYGQKVESIGLGMYLAF